MEGCSLASVFNVKKHRAWAILPLLGLLSHGAHACVNFNPQYLLFVCYPAHAVLVLGILLRLPLAIGIGSFWTICALPLFIHDAVAFSNWVPSGFFFHLAGAAVGVLGICSYKLPRYTWGVALVFGAALQLSARLFTEPAYNINAAFRVYQGYGIFSHYIVYLFISFLGFSLSFRFLQFGNAWILGSRT